MYSILTCLSATHHIPFAICTVVAAVPTPTLCPGVQLAGSGLAAGVYLGTLRIGAAVALLSLLHKGVPTDGVSEETGGEVVYAGTDPAAQR